MASLPTTFNDWIDEYHEGVRYGLNGKVLIDENSRHQRITLIESKRYGKGLLLDGRWMTAEHQERHYHECLVHPALCSAKHLNHILIIGGGDGGTARECLRHKGIEHLAMVEIDKRVVELSQKYLPSLGGDAWSDPRLQININDGITWVANAADASYDVVIVDGSDPTGPAKGLFNQAFFKNCKRILRPGGVFATQSESPEAFRQIHIETVQLIRRIFEFADPLYGSVPMYPSGWWSWTFASTDSPRYKSPFSQRVQQVSNQCEIWSPRWQQGAFEAIPAFIERELHK
ncbi:polyamine aminopropyltransferase [Prochlorococcus sp. MIT 1307]|uniref:polyamine aminopropyltransferase n=1 Tax=Prochlorococcus sp. MIT 1307 TaxID=3096219 RepID=UPI002A756743|nr:polyamine aminopropyltransferase [Prochlorococcus sp. MIT 1307]